MTIIEDTRNKPDKHTLKLMHFAENDVEVVRCKLPFGDYALPPSIAIDTKANMEEIAGNIGGSAAEHQRFKHECINAKRAGCKLIILVENECGITSIDEVHTWANPRSVYSSKCIQGERLEKAMKTMSERYGCEFYFCKPEEAGKKILEILEGETDG